MQSLFLVSIVATIAFAQTLYEVDYGNGNGWMPATTILTNNLNFAPDGGSYKWREVSEKLNNKASIALVPDAELEISVGQTMKIRCQNTCEVYYIWMDKIVLCTRQDTESTCRPKLEVSANRPSSYASLLNDWKDEGVDVVAQQYNPYFTNYDLTRNPTGDVHGFYLMNMAAKSKVLNSEEITVGPATSGGRFFVAFIEIESTGTPITLPTEKYPVTTVNGKADYVGVCFSGDGSKRFMGGMGGSPHMSPCLYESTKSGDSWGEWVAMALPSEMDAYPRNPTFLASSEDGSTLLMSESTNQLGSLWVSRDGGATFNQADIPAPCNNQRTNYECVPGAALAMSADGNLMMYGTSNGWGRQEGWLFKSTDAGVTWTRKTGPGFSNTVTQNCDWTQLAMSSDGKYVVASARQAGQGMYYSTDFGDTWAKSTSIPSGAGLFWSVAMSVDGSLVLAASYQQGIDSDTTTGMIIKSTDYGVTWTKVESPALAESNGSFFKVLVSSNGMRLVAVDQQTRFYVSDDAGATWVKSAQQQGTWANADMSPDGSNMIGITYAQGYIDATFPATVTPPPSGTQSPTDMPSVHPTVEPTQTPTDVPTMHPSKEPTRSPTDVPTMHPSKEPTRSPTDEPSAQPTQSPTSNPTLHPSSSPSLNPTTTQPSQNPTMYSDGILLQNGCPSDYPERYPGTNRCFGHVWGNFGCNIDPKHDPATHHASDRRCVYSDFVYVKTSHTNVPEWMRQYLTDTIQRKVAQYMYEYVRCAKSDGSYEDFYTFVNEAQRQSFEGNNDWFIQFPGMKDMWDASGVVQSSSIDIHRDEYMPNYQSCTKVVPLGGTRTGNGCPSRIPLRYPGTDRCFETMWKGEWCNVNANQNADPVCQYEEDRHLGTGIVDYLTNIQC